MRQLTDRKEQAGRQKDEKKTEEAAADGDATEVKSDGEGIGSETDGKDQQVDEEEGEGKEADGGEEVRKDELGP